MTPVQSAINTPTTTTSCAMSVAPAAAQSQVGVQSEFDVVITNCTDVAGASSKIGFDAHINVDSRLGSPAFPPSCNGIGIDNIDNSGHTVQFGCVRTPLTGVDGGGTLARYLYTCQSLGRINLTFVNSALSNHLAGPIAHTTSDGSLTCTSATTPVHTFTPPPVHTFTPTPPSAGTPTATSPSMTTPGTSTSTPPNTITPAATSTPAPAKTCGDVNDDGHVNAVDAQLILQYSAGLVQTLVNVPSADVNRSGGVTPVDAAIILQAEAGLISMGSLNCS